MITNGSKIQLVKPMGEFTNVGEVCNVVKVTEDGVISFKFGNGLHLGCMSWDEYKKYFVEYIRENKIKPKKNRVWTEWKESSACFNDIPMYTVFTRNNGTCTQAKYINEKSGRIVRAHAKCHKSDNFSYSKGAELAACRLIIKIFMIEIEEFAKTL